MSEKKTDAFFVLLAAENVADSCSKMKARAALAVTHMAVIYLRHVLPPGAGEGGREEGEEEEGMMSSLLSFLLQNTDLQSAGLF